MDGRSIAWSTAVFSPAHDSKTVGTIADNLKSGVWLFESNRPLDPGASHIVRVEAKEHPMDMDAVATRFVRLIPGRIVYLSFGDTME